MNAHEAQRLTKDALRGPLIDGLLDIVHGQIHEAAKAGKSSIIRPFQGLRMVAPSAEQYKALWLALENQGYRVIHHPNPDPEDQRSTAYTEISWG